MPVYQTSTGGIYADTTAHSPNDQQILYPAPNLLAVLTTTAQDPTALAILINNSEDNAGLEDDTGSISSV
jgi:hypothetical protein